MAAATQTGSNAYDIMGNKNVSTGVFTAIADTNTWDTGLRQIDFYSVMIEEAAAAADALTVASKSAGTITFGVAGTIAGARCTAWGV